MNADSTEIGLGSKEFCSRASGAFYKIIDYVPNGTDCALSLRFGNNLVPANQTRIPGKRHYLNV